MKRGEEIELTGELGDGVKEQGDGIQGDGLSLSKIIKDEIGEMRRRTPLYIEWKGTEDEATPSSEAKPMGTGHVSKALNARLEESHVNNFPASLKNMTVTRNVNSITRQYEKWWRYGVGGNW